MYWQSSAAGSRPSQRSSLDRQVRVNRSNNNRTSYHYTYSRAYVRVPTGRVNLIGEHIDYEGYSVLPMAIELDTVVAISVNSGNTISVANVDKDHFSEQSFDVDEQQKVVFSASGSASYFLCGYKGVFDYLREKKLPMPKERYGE